MALTYFKAIEKRVEELDALGQAYLETLPFLSNDEIDERLHKEAWRIFREVKNDWSKTPEWASTIVDGYMPYRPPGSGPLYNSLAFSAVANDALLRNLLEIVEGRETTPLPFSRLAESEIVNQYCEE